MTEGERAYIVWRRFVNGNASYIYGSAPEGIARHGFLAGWNAALQSAERRRTVRRRAPVQQAKGATYHRNVCNSCGEPMSGDCPTCKRLWES